MTVEINPEELVVSEMNERAGKATASKKLIHSVETRGIDPRKRPLVRPVDGESDKFEIVAGQRRVDAAVKAGLESIEVDNEDLSDLEARIESTRENYSGSLSEDVSVSDRALGLQAIWEEMGEDGLPSSGRVGEELGASVQTVSKWIEPLRDGWKGTPVDPRNEEHDTVDLDEVGEATLQLIRNTDVATDDQKLRLVHKVMDNEDTQTSSRNLKNSVEDEDDVEHYLETGELPVDESDPVEDAIAEEEPEDEEDEEDEVTESDSSGMSEIRISFSEDFDQTLNEAAESRGVRKAMLIDEYVQRGLEEDGFGI